MYDNEYNACVNAWVELAAALGLCADTAIMPGGDERLLGSADSLPWDTKRLLTSRLRACPNADLWKRVAGVAKSQAGIQTPGSFESMQALHATLTKVLTDLVGGQNESRYILGIVVPSASNIERLVALLAEVEDGPTLLYLLAACDCLDPDLNSVDTVKTSTCSIQASRGVWKKKSSFAHKYGAGNCVYSSCAYKASWTLITCLGLAILLCAMGW